VENWFRLSKKNPFTGPLFTGGVRFFWIFEKIKKSEALLLGNVTLHCQRMKVIGQRTTDNGQRTCRAGKGRS
jgi:hypothetical protein